LEFYTSYKQIPPIVVKLPNCQQVLATHFGIVKFFETLYLVDVLYLPSFTFNLISISKLVSTLNCKLTFSLNKCVIQDVNIQRMIGLVDVINGLYKSAISSLSNVYYDVTLFHNKLPIYLWHFCFGHPSHDRIHTMKQCYPSLFSDKNFVCDACHRAKQRKLPFPTSNSHASKPFLYSFAC